jgi:lipopolysaccharide export system protein LptA
MLFTLGLVALLGSASGQVTRPVTVTNAAGSNTTRTVDARGSLTGPISGVRAAQYYDPPHQTQLKWLFEGAKGQQQDDNLLLVTEGKVQTWNEDGSAELVIETPECLYDAARQSVRSPGKLKARIGGNRFSIDGEGFYWQQTNTAVVVSNHVHSTVQLEPSGGTNGATAVEKGPIEIFSDRFSYATNSGVAVYEGNARVQGTNLTMHSRTLEVVLPAEIREVRQITARRDVTVDSEDVHCAGQELVYTPKTGVLHVTGSPTWSAQGRRGGAEDLVVDRQSETVLASGQAWLGLPGQGFGETGFVPGKRETTPPGNRPPAIEAATNQLVEIRSTQYELRTNTALFLGGVTVEQTRGDKLLAAMSCRRLLAEFSNAGITNKTSTLEKLLAEDEVIIRQGEDQQLTADQAIYFDATKALLLTGNPAWKEGLREGGGNQITVNGDRGEMTVSGDAVLRSPGTDFGNLTGPGTREGAPISRDAGSNQVAILHSDEQVFRQDNSALVTGHVLLEHPRMHLTCEQMVVPAVTNGQVLRKVVAEGAIVLDASDERAQQIHGTGTGIDYEFGGTGIARTESVTLRGSPARLTTTNSTVENSLIILDRARNRVFVPGRYVLRGTPATDATTNAIPFKRKR